MKGLQNKVFYFVTAVSLQMERSGHEEFYKTGFLALLQYGKDQSVIVPIVIKRSQIFLILISNLPPKNTFL